MFITSRLRTWLIFAVAVPVGTAAVHLVRTRLEARSGQTRLVRTLTQIENLGRRRSGKPARSR